jgi:hypothetical protein
VVDERVIDDTEIGHGVIPADGSKDARSFCSFATPPN